MRISRTSPTTGATSAFDWLVLDSDKSGSLGCQAVAARFSFPEPGGPGLHVLCHRKLQPWPADPGHVRCLSHFGALLSTKRPSGRHVLGRPGNYGIADPERWVALDAAGTGQPTERILTPVGRERA